MASGIFGVRSLQSYAFKDAESRQWELVRTLAAFYQDEDDREAAADRFLSVLPETLGYRITIIESDGTVLADTHEDAEVMSDHGNRPEIRAALTKGQGSSVRRSETLGGELFIYTAYFDPSVNLVFRVARTVQGLRDGLDRSVKALTAFAAALILISALISVLAAKRISNLLKSVQSVVGDYSRGDFSKALILSGFREADELSASINRMGRQLRDTFRDIEDRQTVLRSMLEGMTAPVVLLDTDLNILQVNPAAVELAGTNDEKCVGKGFLHVFRSPELYDIAKRLAAEGGEEESLVRLDRDSGPFFLQVHAVLIRSGCLLVMNDVTRITQLEMMRKDFVANVSHELRTPITSILGFVETLQRAENLDKERRDGFLSIIRRQAERLGFIIGDLMTLSRLEEGETSLPRERVDVRWLFDDAVATVSIKAESKKIRMSMEVADGLECCVHPILVEQALVNLLDNAVKYSPEGSMITLSARIVGTEIIFVVKDNGPGLPESELSRIFERFYRVDKARSRELGGTGLGLAIVKHIALKHGGRVWVESSLGYGCSFMISFPADCEEKESSAED